MPPNVATLWHELAALAATLVRELPVVFPSPARLAVLAADASLPREQIDWRGSTAAVARRLIVFAVEHDPAALPRLADLALAEIGEYASSRPALTDAVARGRDVTVALRAFPEGVGAPPIRLAAQLQAPLASVLAGAGTASVAVAGLLVEGALRWRCELLGVSCRLAGMRPENSAFLLTDAALDWLGYLPHALLSGSGWAWWAALASVLAIVGTWLLVRTPPRVALIARLGILAAIAVAIVLETWALSGRDVVYATGANSCAAVARALDHAFAHEACVWLRLGDREARGTLAGAAGWSMLAAAATGWTLLGAGGLRGRVWLAAAKGGVLLSACALFLALSQNAPRAWAFARWGIEYPRVLRLDPAATGCDAQLADALELAAPGDRDGCRVWDVSVEPAGPLVLFTAGALCPDSGLRVLPRMCLRVPGDTSPVLLH